MRNKINTDDQQISLLVVLIIKVKYSAETTYTEIRYSWYANKYIFYFTSEVDTEDISYELYSKEQSNNTLKATKVIVLLDLLQKIKQNCKYLDEGTGKFLKSYMWFYIKLPSMYRIQENGI